ISTHPVEVCSIGIVPTLLNFRSPEVIEGLPMTTNKLTHVRAAHDITRGDHTVVKGGAPGRVLNSHPSWYETTYTVKFTGIGKNHRGEITLIGLNKDDIQPRRSP